METWVEDNTTTFIVALILTQLWVLPWKGWALWRAARDEKSAWFIALLLINTLGLLEMYYIFGVSKKAEVSKES